MRYEGVVWLDPRELAEWRRLSNPRLRHALGVMSAVLGGLGYPCVVTRYRGGPQSPVHTAGRALDLRSLGQAWGDIPRVLEAVNEALPSPTLLAPTLIWETPRESDRISVLAAWRGPEVPLIVSPRATACHYHLQVPGGILAGTVWDLTELPWMGGRL